MTAFRVEHGQSETTKRGFVTGVDTGTPDVFRTFEQGPPSFYVDDVEVDLHTFLVAVEHQLQGNAMVETRVYGPAEAIDWDEP